ncbi:protein mono-ADP-ribosyltransferase PARP14-like [Mytilus californianus]|uniref:protein mono-ADP-ribosyltransferase PARP14-like n=1 Tax=Mytilus californianus TaxID=6549 RepID=UPI0022484689|nr:protein mono-ADP-ribosyltransferase PARP14-like [Mytilus californianus]
MKLKLVEKEGVATNNTADKNQEQIQHIDTSKQEARDKHITFINKDSKGKTETKMGDIAAQVAMPKAKKLSDSFIQSTNCQSFITKEEIVIRVYVGSILKLNVEGIVNASNGMLSHGGGIANVISRAAGYDFEQDCDAYIQRNGPLKDGECCSTSAGNLHYKCVIHAIGPKWYDYPIDKPQCASVLQRTIENCLHEAEINGFTSVAVPSISAGV